MAKSERDKSRAHGGNPAASDFPAAAGQRWEEMRLLSLRCRCRAACSGKWWGEQEVTCGLPLSSWQNDICFRFPIWDLEGSKCFTQNGTLKPPLAAQLLSHKAEHHRFCHRRGWWGPHLFLGVFCQQEGGWRRDEQFGERWGEAYLCCK